jgi:hypothetical protein
VGWKHEGHLCVGEGADEGWNDCSNGLLLSDNKVLVLHKLLCSV